MSTVNEHPVELFIPAFPEWMDGREVLVAKAIDIHEALDSKQKVSTWIKRRIRRYGFQEGVDYLIHQTVTQLPHLGGMRTASTTDYLVTLDMAKELAMVERTEMGRHVRRYFIECEKQYVANLLGDAQDRVQEDAHLVVDPAALAIDLRFADSAAINRQAWADVAGENAHRFHARREALLRQQRQISHRAAYQARMEFNRPVWAR
jgi:phage anti-repressor protein